MLNKTNIYCSNQKNHQEIALECNHNNQLNVQANSSQNILKIKKENSFFGKIITNFSGMKLFYIRNNQ